MYTFLCSLLAFTFGLDFFWHFCGCLLYNFPICFHQTTMSDDLESIRLVVGME
jgi:hypothetical protein